MKRKSDTLEPSALEPIAINASEGGGSNGKKARTSTKSNALDASQEGSSKSNNWMDIKLEGEDSGDVPVYDDCAEVCRKIRLLQKTPQWKVTHWLQDIGNINSNSFRRFMTAKTKNEGAANGTYYAAYVYFEKVRILEGKKKTGKRLENEVTHPDGFPLTNPPKYVWGRG